MEFISEKSIRELESLGIGFKYNMYLHAGKPKADKIIRPRDGSAFIAFTAIDMANYGISISMEEKCGGKQLISRIATTDMVDEALRGKGLTMKTSKDVSGNFSTRIYNMGVFLLESEGKSEIESVYLAVKSAVSPIRVLISVGKDALSVLKDGGSFPIVLNNRFLKEGDIISTSGDDACLYRVAGKYGVSGGSAVYLLRVYGGAMDIRDLQCGCELYMVMAPWSKKTNKIKQVLIHDVS